MKLFIFLISFSVSLATQDQCGISIVNSGGPTGLIFNGELAEDSQWPWAAAVYLKYGEKRNFLCSGTLISGQSVLTDQFIPFNGTFPRNAVQGGYEGTVKLFVGRKTIDGKHLLGKIADTLKIIYVPYFAKEYEFEDDFDILILSDIGWTSFNSSIDQIPSDAISINEDNLKTYVARRKIDKDVVVGKFNPMLNSLSVTYNGTEFKFSDGIEIMTTNKPHKWIPFTGTFPSNAVQGGYEGAAKLYVGRVRHPTKYIIGKVVDTTRTISVGFFDKEFKYKNSFEILVLEN
ncbi:unnamed protein product [Chironomus riparius]|uniref:Uncharacterized protein n=1 Tax=Chironomus riparius TaxID=315576 RepID=A0A9N9SAF4_9DIPT|nr:unnamed protein product [Chironomus riparius]